MSQKEITTATAIMMRRDKAICELIKRHDLRLMGLDKNALDNYGDQIKEEIDKEIMRCLKTP